MFELERFIGECRAALAAGDAQAAVRETVARAVAEPAGLLAALGEPSRAGLQTLHHDADLTVLNLVWGPGMSLPPHDHRMWAVIGIYGGREDNTFYRRTGDGIEPASLKVLERGDAVALGEPVVHAVANPLDRLTAAIHVYGGDFFGTPRSEWDAESLAEHPLDIENTRRLFDESNRRWEAIVAGGA